jgi:hypothetical protein
MYKVLLKGGCQLNEKNSTLGIIPDNQVGFELSWAEVLWWLVLLGGEIRGDGIVLAPGIVTEVVMHKIFDLSQNCIMFCIIAPLLESHRACIEDMTQGLQFTTQSTQR